MADSSVSHNTVQQTFTLGSGNSHDSFNSNSLARYHGLIRQSYLKVFRKDLMQLFSYIYSVAPPVPFVHQVMTVIRILQFLLPCLCSSFFNFWIRKTVQQITVDVVSVFYHLIPPTAQSIGARYFLYVFLVIKFLVLALVTGSTIYFKKNAKLPGFITSFISLYFATLGHFLHPIALYLDFRSFNRILSKDFKGSKFEFGFVFSLTLILSIIFFWIVLEITSQTLIFRPNSLMAVTSSPMNIIFLVTIFINSLIGLASDQGKTAQIVMLSFVIALYLLSILSVFYHGGFIYSYVNNMVLSSAITGACFSLLVLVCISVGKSAELIFFFALIIFYILVSIMTHFFLQRYFLRLLGTLDLIAEDPVNFGKLVRTPNQFLNLCVVGFNVAHPVCLELKIFMQATDHFNRESIVWYIFAKFVAIYPEETQTLAWIFHNVSSLKLSGSSIRCIKEQSLAISRQREPNLSAELKSKLSVISKQVQSTKHKLRHVWDVVIQGNIGEIESSTKRALKAIEQTDTDFKHLFRQFPNNRFVTRTYARFLLEITADHTLSNQMLEKTRLLQRGISVNNDQTHELGISTFKMLPEHIKGQRDNNPSLNTESTTTTQSYNPDSIDQEDFVRVDLDQLLTLRHRIEELVIPAIRGTQILRTVFMAVFLLFPCIFGFIYINVFITDLQQPLEFLSSLSMLRSYSYQVIGFSLRYVGEYLKVFPILDNITEKPPEHFGNSWDTLEQLKYIVTTTSDAVQEFGSFRKFEQGNINIKSAQDLIFGNTLEYWYCTSPTNATITSLSIQAAIMDLVIQQNTLIANPDISPDIVNTSVVLNPCTNAYNLTTSMNLALQYLTNYIGEVFNETHRISNICLYGLIVVEVLLFIIPLILELRWIKIDKQETYQCLFSLPKNTVSTLAENLRVLNKDNPSDNSSSMNNTEMNKQEENILKIFNSSGSTETPLSDMFLLVFGTLLITGLTIGCIVLFVYLVDYESKCLKESAPHLNYLMGSYAMMLSMFNSLFLSVLYFTPYRVHIFTINESITRIQLRMGDSRTYYHLASYGGTSTSQTPFSGFDDGVRNAQDAINCDITSESVPENFRQAIACYPADMAFILIEPVVTYNILPFIQGVTDKLESKDDTFSVLWHEMIAPLYNNFFYPMHLTIIPIITSQLASGKDEIIPGIVAMLIVAVLIEIILFIQLHMIEQHIRSVLRLFLHCPPEIVLSTPKIMKLLSGDFSTQRADTMNRDSEFFDSVFVSLPDAIMYANPEMVIQAANLSCQRIFGDVPLVDHSIKEFFMSDKFVGKIDILFSSANSNPVEPIIYRKDDGTEMHLEASSMLASGKFVMSCRDVTQTVRYNTLIREERAKSDQLLATILPPSLVKRVQEGEKNISFAVQSASILFSDIVEFTPWCGALPAATVMSTLNILFRRFDAILATKPTMTKIKCIGDCYMAAGGIFAEINQPTEHAKEVVTFGLESIRAILDINKEIGEKLKIRVGVNTGGPIVAGVLGIGKPTFEILGPAINLAQQMEHHGVPMAVHITRSVYELIYGDTFTIRERGSVEVKGGSVITYLVTQKN